MSRSRSRFQSPRRRYRSALVGVWVSVACTAALLVGMAAWEIAPVNRAHEQGRDPSYVATVAAKRKDPPACGDTGGDDYRFVWTAGGITHERWVDGCPTDHEVGDRVRIWIQSDGTLSEESPAFDRAIGVIYTLVVIAGGGLVTRAYVARARKAKRLMLPPSAHR